MIKRVLAKKLSLFLHKHPELLFRTQRMGIRIADRFLDFHTAFLLFKRPEWVRVSGLDRFFSLDFSAFDGDLERGKALAKRMIDSYTSALADEKGNCGVEDGTIWSTLSDRNYARMHSTVVSRDPGRVACFFNEVFRSEAVDGFAMGTWYDSYPHRWWIWGVGIVTSLVCLAEACGLLRAECPEQGQIGYALTEGGLPAILEKLDDYFGFRIESPRVGSARGILIGDRFLSRETCSQLYTAERIRQAFDAQVGGGAPMNILEIGGGYGGLCYWLLKLCGERVKRYCIVDLPTTGLIQSYFLGSVLQERLSLYRESFENARVVLLPHFELGSVVPVNIMINQDSMPEMPSAEINRYLRWGSRHLKGIFLSCNQEAYSVVNGRPQLFVPDFFASIPTYRRISRNTAWDRRGYVEEVYTNDPAAPHLSDQ